MTARIISSFLHCRRPGRAKCDRTLIARIARLSDGAEQLTLVPEIAPDDLCAMVTAFR
jgi:hypothetical protein